MAGTKHEKTFVDYDKSYETNIIGLGGIIWFAVGLLALIVITFGLMWVLERNVEDLARERDAESKNPMRMDKKEQLPPEPRLQSAPGFGVGEGGDRVNLELSAPESEYNELHKRWEIQWANGEKDPKTGTIISLPIEEAKQKLLQENIKVRPGRTGKRLSKNRARSFRIRVPGGWLRTNDDRN